MTQFVSPGSAPRPARQESAVARFEGFSPGCQIAFPALGTSAGALSDFEIQAADRRLSSRELGVHAHESAANVINDAAATDRATVRLEDRATEDAAVMSRSIAHPRTVRSLASLRRSALLVVLAASMAPVGRAEARRGPRPPAGTPIAAHAVNALGLDILRTGFRGEENALLSPYSIQLASAMIYAGSEAETRKELQTALHYPSDEAILRGSFAELGKALEQLGPTPEDPLQLNVANRLYAQTEHAFRRDFVAVLRNSYNATLDLVDFATNAFGIAQAINHWVAERSNGKIPALVSPGALDASGRLVLVNVVYFRAPWRRELAETASPLPFAVRGGEKVVVPTMMADDHFGYRRSAKATAVVLPYRDTRVRCLIILPDKRVDLREVEASLTPALLADLASAPDAPVILYMPKFRLEPPTLSLAETFSRLGMKTAFLAGRADLRRMDSARDLYVSAILHRALLSVDEYGTEATAATAIEGPAFAVPTPDPVEVHVDRPFLIAIEHAPTGALLFLGRVTDPRTAPR